MINNRNKRSSGLILAMLFAPAWLAAQSVEELLQLPIEVQINPLEEGTQFTRQNINLDVLDRIEMIRGPGSALYGENAFHGVLSLRSFESPSDVSQFHTAIATTGYRVASLRHSQSIGSTSGRVHHSVHPVYRMAAAFHHDGQCIYHLYTKRPCH